LPAKKKIAVAMSGGVDSSVSAALLKADGHEVIGITMRLFDGSTAAVEDAARVAACLGIPHHVAAFESCFATEIMTYFVREYQAGRTPNPCARCNQLIKFGAMLDMAVDLGAEYLATGHYARIATAADGTPHLLQAVNLPKDQSYFLFSIDRELLRRIIFPLGEMRVKSDVRRIAADLGIPVAQKDDSQDICFIPDGDYIGFLERRAVLAAPGDFVLADGTVIGRHKGLHRYTVGQRRGMGIAWCEPLYVIRLEPDTNRVVVGLEGELYREGFTINGCNWLQAPAPAETELRCKIRYRHRAAPCMVTPLADGRAAVHFAVQEKGVTPGQAAVFYKGEEVIGGGWIE
jgi:tRNA-uridine 2-sulfurtransferase